MKQKREIAFLVGGRREGKTLLLQAAIKAAMERSEMIYMPSPSIDADSAVQQIGKT